MIPPMAVEFQRRGGSSAEIVPLSRAGSGLGHSRCRDESVAGGVRTAHWAAAAAAAAERTDSAD